MRRTMLIALATTLGAVAMARAQEAPTPLARARLDPGATVTVGQPLRIVVEVLVPSYFTGGPRFATIDVPDAITLFEDRGTNFTERLGSTTFAGQSRSYVIYPQRPGSFRIDDISVSVPYFDDDAGRTTATVAPPPVDFEAVLPPEAEGLSYFISTARLTLRADYDPRPDTLRVGDAFTRTLTATVDDALAMVVPPIGSDSIPGLAVYADPPVVDDQGGERGARIQGTRRESVTYVALEEGEYEVPGVALQWWDVNASVMRTASIDPIAFVVVPAATEAAFELVVDSSAILPAEDETRPFDLVGWLRRYGPIAFSLVALAWIGARVWRRYGPAWIARRQAAAAARADSEATYFDKLRVAARRGDPRQTLNALHAWYDRARGPGDPPAVGGWIAAAGAEELQAAYEGLTAALYSSGAARFDATALAAGVERARKSSLSWKRGSRVQVGLPPLNPTAGSR